MLSPNGGWLSPNPMRRFQRRLLPETHECAYVNDGDQNGVLHFIGTLYGTQVRALGAAWARAGRRGRRRWPVEGALGRVLSLRTAPQAPRSSTNACPHVVALHRAQQLCVWEGGWGGWGGFCICLDTSAGPEPNYRAYQMSRSTRASEPKAHAWLCSPLLAKPRRRG